VVAAGDWVRVSGEGDEGVILDVEPRTSSLSRTSRGKRHVLVANVDQVVIVATAAEPRIMPALIDRFLVAAEANAITPIICINKADLVEEWAFDDAVMDDLDSKGITVYKTSAKTGEHVEDAFHALAGKIHSSWA